MRYWVGPWAWSTVAGQSLWTAPAGSLASLDLRSVPQCAAAATPQGLGLFVTQNATDLGDDYTTLGTAGDPRDLTLGPAARSAWRDAFGLAAAPSGPSLAAVVYEHITALSDPTGDDRACPLQPSSGSRDFDVWLGGVRVGSRRFAADGPEAAPLLDLLRRVYRRVRQECLDGVSPPTHYKKYLGWLARKYRIDYRQFIPGDLPDEGDLPPETTITESFNKADSTTLGPDLSWTEYGNGSATNRFEVLSNTCRVIPLDADNASSARANSDLSGTDHYAQVTISVIGTGTQNKQVGPACRFSSSAQTHYHARILQFNDQLGILKCVAGTQTSLGTPVSQAPTAGNTVRLTCNGSSLTSAYAGVTKETITDTSITTGTRCGVYGYSASTGTGEAQMDSFEAADLAAATNRRRRALCGSR